MVPRQPPDLYQGASLFAQHSAACHGTQGRGDGPLATGMDPAPRNFHDAARMRQPSLYDTVTLGGPSISMCAFKELSEADR